MLDTNILVYFSHDDPIVAEYILNRLPARQSLIIPTIVIVEFLCFPSIAEAEQQKFESIVSYCNIMDLSYDIAVRAAGLRKVLRLSIGDSVIAATALLSGSALVTRNVKDFQKVEGLEIIKL